MSATATSSSDIDSAVSNLQASADMCAYGLTDRRLKPLRTAMQRDPRVKLTVHAGEAAGPENVWEALDVLGASRIGHGVRSIEDPALVVALARESFSVKRDLERGHRAGALCSLGRFGDRDLDEEHQHARPAIRRLRGTEGPKDILRLSEDLDIDRLAVDEETEDSKVHQALVHKPGLKFVVDLLHCFFKSR